ncbi:MAG: asparagine synthase (glutamine-hydrolyzing) [Chloroflexi bacterium]|nr:asparagine synthase (glutamine-hydrolyzing) [Chloroflexota bacterium]
MCGIAGIFNTTLNIYPDLEAHLQAMNQIQAHRGPDADKTWIHPDGFTGFGHRRLAIIDLKTGAQPLADGQNVICYNGEIYNYIELKEQLEGFYNFKTQSDTEVILAAYKKWGTDCVNHLRGMFAFAIWDESKKQLFCARDRFGIKPFYYTIVDNIFYFASEAKALLPFLSAIETDLNGLKDYFVFQLCLGDKTLFMNIKQLLPAHILTVRNGQLTTKKYWEVNYTLDWERTEHYFHRRVRELLEDSIRFHLRSDVPIGAYLSGGIDSSLVATLANKYRRQNDFKVFHGKFSLGKEYDESEYAKEVAQKQKFNLLEIDIKSNDFIDNVTKVIYHLDYPAAGPGSFPQYMVSQLAGKNLKVVLGGQGGDEVFGGYARYLLAYFEQCIKGAIDGTLHSGKFIVTYESIIPNLRTLQEYKPLMKEFWSDGLFEDRDRRYFRLISRANTLKEEVNWKVLEPYSAFETFKKVFWSENVEKESYFDSMTHFDFKTLLPALLQVEDRMSMAHGLESRVPILDHPLIEFVATVPSNIKFQNGELKHLLKTTFSDILPPKIVNRKDKMGFPVPFDEWMRGDIREFISDIFSSKKARQREYLNPEFDISSLISKEDRFSRKLWGLLCLELWQQEFHDKANYYQKMTKETCKQAFPP